MTAQAEVHIDISHLSEEDLKFPLNVAGSKHKSAPYGSFFDRVKQLRELSIAYHFP